MIDWHEQKSVEADVLAMLGIESVKRARDTAAQLFALAHGREVPDEARASFDSAIDEYVANYLFKAAASDAAFPRFAVNFLPPHHCFGSEMAGARMGGDNPDNLYRLAGIEHGGRYRVKGRKPTNGPANVSFTLVANYGTSVTIDGVEDRSLVIGQDGSFTITIDTQPANGRNGHLTTKPGAKFLFVRDSFSNWTSEQPVALTIERLDHPDRARVSIEEMAERAAFRLIEDVPLYFWFHRLFSAKTPNVIAKPLASGPLGGLKTQAANQGQLNLSEGEAAIVRFNRGTAAYAAVQLGSWWFQSIDGHRRQSTITYEQAVIGEDGWAECIVAPEDPGFANWLDSVGLRQVLLFGRWQGLGSFSDKQEPDMTCEIVRLADLAGKDNVAGGRVDSAFRAAQINARRVAWDRRFRP